MKKKLLVCLMLMPFVLGGCGNTSTGADDGSKPAQEETSAEDVKKEDEPYNNTAESTELFSGNFTVGTDLVAGRYVITTPSGNGNISIYGSESKNDLIVNEVLCSSTEDSFGIGVTQISCDITDGNLIEIAGLNSVSFEPAEIALSTTLTAGTYLVGRDVEKGNYIATTNSGTGNFVVYSKSGLPNTNEILGVDEATGMGVEKVKISLKDGEIISISGLNEVILQ